MIKKYKLEDLLNQSDASALRPAEDAEWLVLSDQGRELWAQIDQTMLRVKSGEEKVYSSAVVREQLGMDD
jgi:CHASE3 domain sensor protein